jgi:hypothetical protein
VYSEFSLQVPSFLSDADTTDQQMIASYWMDDLTSGFPHLRSVKETALKHSNSAIVEIFLEHKPGPVLCNHMPTRMALGSLEFETRNQGLWCSVLEDSPAQRKPSGVDSPRTGLCTAALSLSPAGNS